MTSTFDGSPCNTWSNVNIIYTTLPRFYCWYISFVSDCQLNAIVSAALLRPVSCVPLSTRCLCPFVWLLRSSLSSWQCCTLQWYLYLNLLKCWCLQQSTCCREDFLGDTTKCGAGQICRVDRHRSVVITWLIPILSLSPAVSIQQSTTLTNPNANPITNPNPNHIPTPNPSPNSNPTVITDLQISPRHTHTVLTAIFPGEPGLATDNP